MNKEKIVFESNVGSITIKDSGLEYRIKGGYFCWMRWEKLFEYFGDNYDLRQDAIKLGQKAEEIDE